MGGEGSALDLAGAADDLIHQDELDQGTKEDQESSLGTEARDLVINANRRGSGSTHSKGSAPSTRGTQQVNSEFTPAGTERTPSDTEFTPSGTAFTPSSARFTPSDTESTPCWH
jgi:hypothetical protein